MVSGCCPLGQRRLSSQYNQPKSKSRLALLLGSPDLQRRLASQKKDRTAFPTTRSRITEPRAPRQIVKIFVCNIRRRPIRLAVLRYDCLVRFDGL